MERTSRGKKFLASKLFTLLILLVVIFAFFAIASEGSFIHPINLKNILNAMVLYTLLAIGVGMLIISGEIDLSPGYVGTTCGVFLAVMLHSTAMPWFIVLILSFLIGIIFGLFNAFLVNELGFQSFIATLATGSFVAKGLTYVIAGGKTVSIKNPVVLFVGTHKFFNFVPVAIIISLVAILIYGIILAKTKFGRSVYLSGGNRNAARLSGINHKKISYILFANSGFLGALAGILLDGRLKSGNVNGTNEYTFTAITAAILGGISFGGGSGGMLGCFLGLLIMNGFNNGLTVLGVNPYWQSVASGVLLLVALTFDYVSTRRNAKVHAPKPVKAQL